MACRSCKRQLLQVSRQAQLLNPDAHSLAVARHLRRQVAPAVQQSRGFRASARAQKSIVPQFVKDLGSQLLRSTAQPYQVNKATETIYKTCSREASYTISETDKRNATVPKTEDGEEIGEGTGSWHKDFNLPPTFSTWSQVTMLHMYLVSARLRNLDREAAKSWQQQLVDHFFFDAEQKMDVTHNITSGGIRQRYLKDLFVQWRGAMLAYDEGVYKGDAVLAGAVWRNVFKGREDVDVRSLAAIVSWMRLCLKMLDQMPDEALFFQTTAAFKWPARNELLVVDTPVKELADILRQEPASAPKATPLIEKVAV